MCPIRDNNLINRPVGAFSRQLDIEDFRRIGRDEDVSLGAHEFLMVDVISLWINLNKASNREKNKKIYVLKSCKKT